MEYVSPYETDFRCLKKSNRAVNESPICPGAVHESEPLKNIQVSTAWKAFLENRVESGTCILSGSHAK